MVRSFRVAGGMAVGYEALILSSGIVLLYMPFSPAALVWPYEWVIVGVWSAIGVVLYLWASIKCGNISHQIVMDELASGQTAHTEPAE